MSARVLVRFALAGRSAESHLDALGDLGLDVDRRYGCISLDSSTDVRVARGVADAATLERLRDSDHYDVFSDVPISVAESEDP